MSAGFISSLCNFLFTLTLASSFLFVGARRLESAIKSVVLQALLLALTAAVRGWATGVAELYLAALLTLAVKAVIIPFILYKVVARIGSCREVKSYVSMKMSFVACAALVIVAYSVTVPIIGNTPGDRSLPTAMAMMLIGFWLMVTRKIAINQVMGLLIIENGIFMAGLGAANGMPPVIELGIFLDALVGVLIMGILVFRINRAFETIDTEILRNLRG